MKTVKVRLFRLAPPFVRSVTVGQITVAGFIELLRLMATKASEVRVSAGREITAEDLIRALREPEFNALADAVCKGEEAGFFQRWLSLRNVRAVYQASHKVNDWSRIFACVNWTGAETKARRNGSLTSDIQIVSRMYQVDPMAIYAWPMEFFLNFVAAMNLAVEESEPEPMPVDMLRMIPGVEVVH